MPKLKLYWPFITHITHHQQTHNKSQISNYKNCPTLIQHWLNIWIITKLSAAISVFFNSDNFSALEMQFFMNWPSSEPVVNQCLDQDSPLYQLCFSTIVVTGYVIMTLQSVCTQYYMLVPVSQRWVANWIKNCDKLFFKCLPKKPVRCRDIGSATCLMLSPVGCGLYKDGWPLGWLSWIFNAGLHQYSDIWIWASHTGAIVWGNWVDPH